MKRIIAISALALAGTAASLFAVLDRRETSRTEMTADLERDLDLATSTISRRTATVSPIEGGVAQPAPRKPPRKSAPPSAHHDAESQAAPSLEVAQEIETPDLVQAGAGTATVLAETANQSPAQTAVDEAPAPGGPSTAPVPDNAPADDANGGDGRSREGGVSGIGAIIGGVTGVILRGGSAGHDNCEPAPRRGTLGTIGGVLAGGMGAPQGSIPQGRGRGLPNPGGRRW